MSKDDYLPGLTFVLGGARSGKSTYAQHLAESARTMGNSPLDLVLLATAEAGDEEMAERIARHKAERGPRWRAIETPIALSAALRKHSGPDRVILVDCITFWLSNLMHAGHDVDQACHELLATLTHTGGPVILISNEVGMGIVPDNPLAREFRDHAGRIHQRIAAVAHRVVFMVAGLALPLNRH